MVGVSGDYRFGISPALKLRLQRPPALSGHPSSCISALYVSEGSLFSAVPVPFTHIALYMRRSVFYPLLAHLVACLGTYVDRCRYTTPICLCPPFDASAWGVEIPLALVGDHIEAY